LPVSFIKTGLSRKAEADIQLMYLKIIIKKTHVWSKANRVKSSQILYKYSGNIMETLWYFEPIYVATYHRKENFWNVL